MSKQIKILREQMNHTNVPIFINDNPVRSSEERNTHSRNQCPNIKFRPPSPALEKVVQGCKRVYRLSLKG